ncbi:MAG: gliding motility-associated C-terminal domain-containing protein [Candidatus Bipolaricaulis sp.]|nr:gliding motility-associated C-terminal domain-containing protein [Candidatus Bipolaricaulis sp.]
MKRAGRAATVVVPLLLVLCVTTAWATEAELYFSADSHGESRVTKVREGEQVWIVVYDPDEDIDCDVRDKVWTDIKVFDAKTGAHIVWKSYKSPGGDAHNFVFGDAQYVPYKGHWPGETAGWTGADYLEEIERGAGLFVSSRPFQIGTRVKYSHDGRDHAHIVGPYDRASGGAVAPTDFQWGGYLYADDNDAGDEGDDRVWVSAKPALSPPAAGKAIPGFVDAQTSPVPGRDAYLPNGDPGALNSAYMLGRFENMDTLVGLYADQDDPSDVALALAKIEDTEAEIRWDESVYSDGNEAATITIVDDDENLSCNDIEMVPVFVIVNPGSWNWQGTKATSASDFWGLNRWGGVADIAGTPAGQSLLWCNIYDSGMYIDLGSRQPNKEGTYYIQYPTADSDQLVSFDTLSDSGITRVMFYATETGADTGVFKLKLNSILRDLGFRTLNVRDVLVAYYLDPNDQDDFKLSLAYISEKKHSSLRFTDYARNSQSLFWLGRDPVYVEVVDENANQEACCPERVVVQVVDPHEVDDTEWLILDELSSNSPVFFTNQGMELLSVWDALGVGDPNMDGGYSLELDNWSLEAFNEDSIYVRYNDVKYTDASLTGLGDRDVATAFPPAIESVRSANDVAFSVFEVADTQVYDGSTVEMYFLDRNGNRVSGYANSDCVFIEVIDPDQNEDTMRRERVAAFWDGTAGAGQNIPHGPMNYAQNHLDSCGFLDSKTHIVNELLGDTNIFDAGTWGKIYILNPRNGRWASSDLFETGTNAGDFVSVSCVDLVSQYECAPSLGVLPGDTILAAYQDPSNHSDIAWISIKVSVGGTQPVEGSTTRFVDELGMPVSAYVEGDLVYVRVDDPTLVGAGTVPNAVTIDDVTFDLSPLATASAGAFITEGIDLASAGYAAGDTATATYRDPGDSSDTSSASVPIVAGEFSVEEFYTAPNPFDDVVRFAYHGAGLAETFSVSVYDLAGHLVWSTTASDVLSVEWDGRSNDGDALANGGYIYVVLASSGEKEFPGKGILFINR